MQSSPTRKKAGVCAIMSIWLVHIKEHVWTIGTCPTTILLSTITMCECVCEWQHWRLVKKRICGTWDLRTCMLPRELIWERVAPSHTGVTQLSDWPELQAMWKRTWKPSQGSCGVLYKWRKFKFKFKFDAELVFQSWWADILANIQDRELDKKAAIQLIKEQTLDNAHWEVKFQLDLCGGEIMYQNLLRHLSIAFQGGDNKANLLAEFYSHGQNWRNLRRLLRASYRYLPARLLSRSRILGTTSTQHWNSVMPASCLTAIARQ